MAVSKTTRFVAAGALGVVIAGGLGVTASLANGGFSSGPSQAQPSGDKSTNQVCGVSDLDITTGALVSPNDTDFLSQVQFTAKPGVTCTLQGAPSGVKFIKADGFELTTTLKTSDAEAPAVTVTQDRAAVFYVRTAKNSVVDLAAEIGFTLPGETREVFASWHLPVGDTVEITPIAEPVS